MKMLSRIAWLFVIPGLLMGFAGCGDDDDDSSSTSMTGLSGELTKDLTAGGSPYIMTGDVTIPDGANVSIDEGVEVFVNGYHAFKVEGRLEARGMEDAYITFTSNRSLQDRGDWKGIWLMGADEGTVLEYVRVQYANKYDLMDDTTRVYDHEGHDGMSIIYDVLHRGAITVLDCAPVIRRCIIENGGYDGIQVIGGIDPATVTDDTVRIEYNTIVGNAFNAIRIEPHWVRFWDNLGNSIPKTKISNNIIVENDDAGIRLPDRIEALYSGGLIPTLLYNDIWNNVSLNYVPGEFGIEVDHSTDIHVNPVFIDASAGDYHLHPCSGVVDAADPNDGSDPDGTRKDLGALPLYQNATDLSKVLKGDKLTLQAGTDYHITCHSRVEEGDVLTIGAGARIFFDGPYSLIIEGNIDAVGNASNPILFTSNQEEPKRADWRQIVLAGVDESSIMEHVVIEYGSVERLEKADPDTLGALSVIGCSPTLNNLTIRESYRAALFCTNGAMPSINRLAIDSAGMEGIVCNLNSNPIITDIVIRNVDTYGLLLTNNSSPNISNALIYNVRVAGLKVLERSKPIVSNLTLYGKSKNSSGFSQWMDYGIIAEGHSKPTFNNCVVAEYDIAGAKVLVSSEITFDAIGLYTSFVSSPETPTMMGASGDYVVSGLVESDPGFVNPEEGDFSLSSGSPVSGMGATGWPLNR